VPVVVRKPEPKKGQSQDPVRPSATVSEPREPKAVPTSVFVAVIAIVVVVVLFAAYRLFGPGESWDNSKQGSAPSSSALSGPPPVARTGGAAGAGQGQDQDQGGSPADQPVGAELPPGQQ